MTDEQTLIAEAVLGRDAQEFLASEIGRYLLGRAQMDEREAMEARFATQAERLDIVSHLGLNHAPILHYKAIAPATVADALALADGPSLNAAVKREGLVFKSLCGSQSWKAISNKWLLKHE